jgi:putative hydrolase of the HAD superfamily
MRGHASQMKGLLLDFGGVITRSFFETRHEFEALLGLPPDTFGWRGPFDPRSDGLWSRLLAGELEEGEYWTRCAEEAGARLGERWTMREFCRRHADLPDEVIYRPEAMRLIADAKQAGVRLAIVSNELEALNGREWIESNPVVRSFDAVVDATHTGIRKPDPRACELALQALDVRAEDAVFIDDQAMNVGGADKAGICAIHLDITSLDVAFAAARTLLGLGPRAAPCR